jgi:hypothetical protein
LTEIKGLLGPHLEFGFHTLRRLLVSLLILPIIVHGDEAPSNADTKIFHPANPEQGGLRLEASATLDDFYMSKGLKMEWGGAHLEVEIAIQNVSPEPLTVPTSAYDGKVDVVEWPGWGPGMERIMFWIDSPRFQGKPTAYAASRFAPVVLAPGERALLLHRLTVITDRKHADSIKEISVHFGVMNSFVGPQGWWKGNLETRTKILRRSDPDREIAAQNTYQERNDAEKADPRYFEKMSGRIAALIAKADRAGIHSEMEAQQAEVVVSDPQWIRKIGEVIAGVRFTKMVSCLCTGWRTAYFYKDGHVLVSVAAIHGNQLRIQWTDGSGDYWTGGGGDFPVDEADWKAVSSALQFSPEADLAKEPTPKHP